MKTVALMVSSAVNPDQVRGLAELLRRHQYEIRVPEALRAFFASLREELVFLPRDTYLDGCELVLVLGGDGSMIEAAREVAGRDIPLAGINFGRLGYMTALDKDDPKLLHEILHGNYKTEERIMLDASVIRNGQTLKMPYPSLNEIIVSNAPVTKLLSFDLYCNGIRTQNYRADGIIIATPSGSTAYSLAAGGPVVSPSLDCLLATPLCPHSLTSRPVVFDGDTVIEIKNLKCRDNTIYVASDGRDILDLEAGDTVIVRRSGIKIRLVRQAGDGFLNTLYKKMNENG